MEQGLKTHWAGWAGSIQQERPSAHKRISSAFFPGQVGQVARKRKPAHDLSRVGHKGSDMPQWVNSITELQIVVARCRAAGIELAAMPDGQLQVRASTEIPGDIRTGRRRLQVVLLIFLTHQPLLACPACEAGAWLSPLADPHLPGRHWGCWNCGERSVTLGRGIVWHGPDGVVRETLRQ